MLDDGRQLEDHVQLLLGIQFFVDSTGCPENDIPRSTLYYESQ